MSQVVILSATDAERKRPLDITRIALQYLARGGVVDAESVNQKAHKVFGYPSAHAMRAQAGKIPLPALGTITRMDIHLRLTKNLRDVAQVPFLPAFCAIEKAKLRILDIDRRTVEACAEASRAAIEDSRPGMRIMVDRYHRRAEPLEPNLRISKLIAAGAPGYRLIVRKDSFAFDWPLLIKVTEAIDKTAGKILEGDPLFADCSTSEEAIDRYLQNIVVPEAWVSIDDLVSDGLEIPHHEVLALYTKDGLYVGRVIHHPGLNAVIPKLFYTDEELSAGMVSFFNGRHEQNLGLGSIVFGSSYAMRSNSVRCDEPVFFSRTAPTFGLSVKDYSDRPTIDPRTLELLPGLRCGSSGIKWAIDGERTFLRKGDRDMHLESYAPTDKWLSPKDFPLLFPLDQKASNVAAPSSWSDRFKETLILPSETIEFQKRVTQKIRRDVAEARQILEDPNEQSALLRLLLDRISVRQIESTAERLEATYYTLPEGTPESELDDERERLEARRQQDQKSLPRSVAASLKNYPFLTQFGPMTNWVLTRETLSALSDCSDQNMPVEVAIWVELIVLASAAAAGKPAIQFRFNPAIMAVGRWAEGRASLEEVLDLASVFSSYQYWADHLEAKVASVSAAISEAIDGRERALELGVKYAGERVIARPSGRVKKQ